MPVQKFVLFKKYEKKFCSNICNSIFLFAVSIKFNYNYIYTYFYYFVEYKKILLHSTVYTVGTQYKIQMQ